MKYHVSMTVELTGTADVVAKKTNSEYVEGYIAALIESSTGSEAKVLDIHVEVEAQ